MLQGAIERLKTEEKRDANGSKKTVKRWNPLKIIDIHGVFFFFFSMFLDVLGLSSTGGMLRMAFGTE